MKKETEEQENREQRQTELKLKRETGEPKSTRTDKQRERDLVTACLYELNYVRAGCGRYLTFRRLGMGNKLTRTHLVHILRAKMLQNASVVSCFYFFVIVLFFLDGDLRAVTTFQATREIMRNIAQVSVIV